MVKKILYGLFCAVFGFVVFYICWRGSSSKAVVNRSNDAINSGDYTFFLKFVDYAKKTPAYTGNYDELENTTDLKIFEFYSKNVSIDEEEKVIEPRSGFMFIFANVNSDVIKWDEFPSSSSSFDEEKCTKFILFGKDGASYSLSISTYGMDECNVYMLPLSSDYIAKKIGAGTTAITGIKIIDSEGTKMYEDMTLNIELVEHFDEEYWKSLDSNEVITGFTSKEYRDNVSFAFPEMNSSFIITAITLVALAGIGVFIFWPKKSRVPDEEEFKDRFTFKADDDKEKTAIERIAKEKKEKDDRLNKYKNVRSNSDNEIVKVEDIEETQENTQNEDLTENKDNNEE